MFWVLGRLLHRGSLLLFRQLTDGPETMKHANASFEGMLRLLGGDNYMLDHSDLMEAVRTLRLKKNIRDHVNKYIAHLDLDLLAGAQQPPASVEILDFEDSLRIMRDLISKIRDRFLPDMSVLELEADSDLIGDQSKRLVDLLRSGLRGSSAC